MCGFTGLDRGKWPRIIELDNAIEVWRLGRLQIFLIRSMAGLKYTYLAWAQNRMEGLRHGKGSLQSTCIRVKSTNKRIQGYELPCLLAQDDGYPSEKCDLSMNPNVRPLLVRSVGNWSFGWLICLSVGRSVIISQKAWLKVTFSTLLFEHLLVLYLFYFIGWNLLNIKKSKIKEYTWNHVIDHFLESYYLSWSKACLPPFFLKSSSYKLPLHLLPLCAYLSHKCRDIMETEFRKYKFPRN